MGAVSVPFPIGLGLPTRSIGCKHSAREPAHKLEGGERGGLLALIEKVPGVRVTARRGSAPRVS